MFVARIPPLLQCIPPALARCNPVGVLAVQVCKVADLERFPRVLAVVAAWSGWFGCLLFHIRKVCYFQFLAAQIRRNERGYCLVQRNENGAAVAVYPPLVVNVAEGGVVPALH